MQTTASRACRAIVPGLALCTGVTALAYGIEAFETYLSGRNWLETLVLAILVGAAIRTIWGTPSGRFRRGIDFGAKQMLEVAVALLGASISFRTLGEIGPGLLLGVVGVVALAIPTSFGICRVLGLPNRLSLLVACGNSICGNSAIAAVAPAIGAEGDDVAASIAFTAVLGVFVVLCLPLFGVALNLSQVRFGAFAGLTVYAVPQVLAAAAPVGPAAVHIGTLVKLVRVMMLGPVVLVMSVLAGRLRDKPAPEDTARNGSKTGRLPVHRMVPPFIVAFFALAALRTAGLVPDPALAPVAMLAKLLTIVSMAALGLGVDVRVLAKAGPRVACAVTFSLIALGAGSLLLICNLGLT